MVHLTMIDLYTTLEAAGVTGLRETPKEIVARCPRHLERTGKEDVHPSWSLNKMTTAHFCFSCGYRGTLTTLLVDLTGSAPVDLDDELRKQSFLRRLEARDEPDKTLANAAPVLTEWALTNVLTDVPERLLQLRALRRTAIDRYQVRYSGPTKQWVMPMWDPAGNLMGAQYRQRGSVLTLPPEMAKSTSLFGYHLAKPQEYTAVVESPLDAVRLYQATGVAAVSTLGAWISNEQVKLMSRAFAFVILALDNDKTGHQGTEVARKMFHRRGCATMTFDYTGLTDDEGRPAKDPGDVACDTALADAWQRTLRWSL